MPVEISVVIAEDQELLRASLVTLLNADSHIRVVGEAADGVEAADIVTRHAPDIVLMDIRMPRLDGIAATAAIAQDPSLRETRVIILTMFELEDYVYQALRAGAAGFLLKDTTPTAVVQAVRTVHDGQRLLSPSALHLLIERFVPEAVGTAKLAALTPRQTEVLRLVARGLSNQEIEETLHISHATMKTHMSALLERLGARDRAQLVIMAYEGGLVG
ncbi:response regulator transcription factor [Actinobaculum sp. 352]|nr:DNA-binding response regulator [Actinobaculum sp. 313]RTE50968.1 response regulator transcription factor [Actinobaculum sp. 352]